VSAGRLCYRLRRTATEATIERYPLRPPSVTMTSAIPGASMISAAHADVVFVARQPEYATPAKTLNVYASLFDGVATSRVVC
jgi:hypothetical protein